MIIDSLSFIGLHGFTLDPLIGEFVLTHPNVRIPRRGRTYSFNEAREQWWPNGLQEYIGKIKRGKGETESTYSARYIGSMVGDIHRTLLNGGIFGYPGDSKSKNGKLRLLYESAPIAYLIEQAGGKASTGSGRLLDVVPESIHEHVSTILGSYDDVVELEKYLANNDATESK